MLKKNKSIKEGNFYDNFIISNNCIESINVFIKSLIPFNESVGINVFLNIIRSLLIIADSRPMKRKGNEKCS